VSRSGSAISCCRTPACLPPTRRRTWAKPWRSRAGLANAIFEWINAWYKRRPIVGQIVSRMNSVRSTRAVLDELVEELDTTIGALPEVLET
jgi:hypothetical protein